MRIVSLLAVLLSVSVVSAQEDKGEAILRQMQSNIPATLAEIDAMPSEDGMIKYHFSWGLNIRNGWGVWAGGPLAEHLRELGFTHADEMSAVILDPFWCRRHGKNFRLEELAAKYEDYWDTARNTEEEEETRVEESNAAVRDMMMGLRRGIRISEGHTTNPTNNAIHLKPEYDDSVTRGFLPDPATGEHWKAKPGDDFYVLAFHFDLTERRIHLVRPEEDVAP